MIDVGTIFERLAEGNVALGVAYGVVMDGGLAHADGFGTLRDATKQRPNQDSVFRIASMTKGFTAAAILLLRDEGRLRLDDRVTLWVPELLGVDPPTTDAPPITIDHLLTMSAGFPTDDPWGDRQQGLDFDEFARLLRRGVVFAWAPGTRYEYSNLGYGILGRIVTRVAGIEYRDFVRERLLDPLRMGATTYLRDEVPDERLAVGYVRRDGAWLEEPIDPYGALASMGGLFTSVGDLARWVAGFVDAFPPRDTPDIGHPLSRATRREMQQVHRTIDPTLTWGAADAAPTLLSGGYGYGLSVWDDLRLGRVVEHGGGYPGYGSFMRWHPASGIGVIAFANARYARMDLPVREAVSLLVERQAHRIRRLGIWPQTTAARTIVEQLLDHWSDEAALDLFSMNVELDEPLARRRAEFQRLRELHGPLRSDPAVAPESVSPAHLAWWMNGERGRLRVEILLSPERPPLVQKLTLTSVPEPPVELRKVAEILAELLGQPGPTWPLKVALAATADQRAIERALRAAEALFGPVTLGAPIAGDGAKQATWRLAGERGELDLQIELDEPGGRVSSVTVVPRAMSEPVHPV
ncbi:MAG: hypothetical protein QOJ75_1434 [Chloroflexota bacterium]|nr:hypothetical protein [Chloroflexota bacterium]